MAKVKISKKSTKIDMTAMCDVAFLLLSFFIMTSTAKVPEPKPVDTPASTVQAKLPEHDLATITIGDSAVYFSMTDRDLRVKALEIMADKYGMEFSEDEKAKFALIDGFGVPMDELKSLIALPGAERNREGLQKGIPYETPADSTKKSQLGDWVLSSREALVELRTKDLKFAIKGDGKEKYPTVRKVLDMMQKQEVNNFYLVTGLRSEDF